MLPLTRGMATTAMVDIEVTMVATTDLTDTTATTARDLLMRPLRLVPMPRPPLTPGMATMDTEVTMVATMVDLMVMATTARDLPMRPPPLSPDPTLRPTPTPGIPTMEDMAMELTDLMDMATTLTVLTLTGDKK